MFDWLRKIFETRQARAERLLEEHLEAERKARLYWNSMTVEERQIQREIRMGLRPFIRTNYVGNLYKTEEKVDSNV